MDGYEKGYQEKDGAMSDRSSVPDDADAVDRDPSIIREPEDDQEAVPQHFPGDEPVDRMLADEGEGAAAQR